MFYVIGILGSKHHLSIMCTFCIVFRGNFSRVTFYNLTATKFYILSVNLVVFKNYFRPVTDTLADFALQLLNEQDI